MVKKKKETNIADDYKSRVLPQNIISMGERVNEDKNIYINQSIYKTIHKFTLNKTVNESGGILVGSVVQEFGKDNIIILGFIEAKYCEATPTTLKFTHKTWEYCHKEIERKHKGKTIVGWIHTHPNFGIFLSEYDKFIQQNFFNEPSQIAYVIDPVQNQEGFYFWNNKSIEKCGGFYVFDKTGVKIDIDNKIEDTIKASELKKEKELFTGSNLILMLLTIIVSVLLFYSINLKNQLAIQKEELDKYNNNFIIVDQLIKQQDERIRSLENNLNSKK